jgi:hypothetical protein
MQAKAQYHRPGFAAAFLIILPHHQSCHQSEMEDGHQTGYDKRRLFLYPLVTSAGESSFAEHQVSMIALLHARPYIYLPGNAPAGTFIAAVTALIVPRLSIQAVFVHDDLVTGIHTPHMRYMPMRVGSIILVFQPFLQLPVFANLI